METFGQGDGTRQSGLYLESLEQAVETNGGTTTSSIIDAPSGNRKSTEGIVPTMGPLDLDGQKDDTVSGLSQEQIFQLELRRIEMQREIKEQEMKSLLELQRREMEVCIDMMS